jgi:hypothetical protein
MLSSHIAVIPLDLVLVRLSTADHNYRPMSLLLYHLEHWFGLSGPVFSWLESYLTSVGLLKFV